MTVETALQWTEVCTQRQTRSQTKKNGTPTASGMTFEKKAKPVSLPPIEKERVSVIAKEPAKASKAGLLCTIISCLSLGALASMWYLNQSQRDSSWW